jgi:LmbE family N-acetylglucosaminyl deacetylase
VIVAHPDDPEFACGGTVAKWATEGAEVEYVIATAGCRGSDDPSMTPERLRVIRKEEQLRAAEALGVTNVTFLDFVDGEVEPTLELRHAFVREIRRVRPDTVVTFDPARIYYDNYVNHPDHRFVGEAALYAVFPAARDRMNAPALIEEGLAPHKVEEVLLLGAMEPDVWIDIGDTLETKIRALKHHKSQIGTFEGFEDRVRKRAADAAAGHGMEFAEIFKRITFYR